MVIIQLKYWKSDFLFFNIDLKKNSEVVWLFVEIVFCCFCRKFFFSNVDRFIEIVFIFYGWDKIFEKIKL